MFETNSSKAAPEVKSEVDSLLARPKDPFVGFSQKFNEENPYAVGIISQHLAVILNSSEQSNAGRNLPYQP